jgi:uncharacterized membrane protein YfhO
MAQVIPQLCLSVAAVLGLTHLLNQQGRPGELFSKKILIPLGSLFSVLFVVWLLQDYGAPIDAQLLASYTANGSDEFGQLIVNSLEQERRGMFGVSFLRALLLALVLLGLIWLYLKNWVGKLWIWILLIISTLELAITSYEYIPKESYVSAEDYQQKNFAPSPIDQEIKKDSNSHFRVLNLTTSTFNDAITSYHHRSIGGYHAAKLRIYQDLIEKYFTTSINPSILSMLNTKYVIVNDPGTNQPALISNRDSVMGNCWFVDSIVLTENRAASLKALGEIDLRTTALAERSTGLTNTVYEADTTASIKLSRFDNDTLTYESVSSKPRFAVMSEIYYPAGWNAYLDGKKIDYVNVNYVLRGLPVPAGNHRIEFIFEPASVKKGNTLMYMSSILIGLVTLGGLGMALYQRMAPSYKAAADKKDIA